MEITEMVLSIKEIIINAGSLMIEMGKSERQVQTKSDGSPVTQVDEAIGNYLHTQLTQLFPEAGWLSEESKDDPIRLTSDWVWIVDPLDGTKEFIKNIPEYSISIGLCFKGEVMAGAVYNPATGEGAVGDVINKNVVSWGINDKYAEQIIPVSRTELSKPKMQIAANSLIEHGYELLPVGSVAYKLLRVATGINSLTFSLEPKSEWDICGGVALLHAMGCKFNRFDGRQVTFNNPNPLYNTGSIGGKNESIKIIMSLLDKVEF